MKIYSAQQIREWDAFTIANEPLSSLALMERASLKCVEWIIAHYPATPAFTIFCGKGNNGGDGLAIARLLHGLQYKTTVYILEFGYKGTPEFQENLSRLHLLEYTDIHFIQSELHFPSLPADSLIIDALFGSGLNRPLEGVTAALATHINNSGCKVIAIDIPSGMFTDRSSGGGTCVRAIHTLTFQAQKLAFLVPENAANTGDIQVLDIGLHPGFEEHNDPGYEMIDNSMMKSIIKPRPKFAHKGNFGHALLLAGSYGKTGAAVLAARACLRSGVGVVTCHIPARSCTILQAAVPEAMAIMDNDDHMLSSLQYDPSDFDSAGIGPGLGTSDKTTGFLEQFLKKFSRPMVIDADALNILAANRELQKLIPPGSILTPHPKEFERLFGKSEDDFQQLELATNKARELGCVIVLKGHHSFVTTGSKDYFNSSGNAGMATGGSGDVLTGLLAGLLAQGYSSIEAALLGVYLHGLAGDLAASTTGMEALAAGDLPAHFGQAFRVLHGFI